MFPKLAGPGICRVPIVMADAGPLGSFHIHGDAVKHTGLLSPMLTVFSYFLALRAGCGPRLGFSLPFQGSIGVLCTSGRDATTLLSFDLDTAGPERKVILPSLCSWDQLSLPEAKAEDGAIGSCLGWSAGVA